MGTEGNQQEAWRALVAMNTSGHDHLASRTSTPRPWGAGETSSCRWPRGPGKGWARCCLLHREAFPVLSLTSPRPAATRPHQFPRQRKQHLLLIVLGGSLALAPEAFLPGPRAGGLGQCLQPWPPSLPRGEPPRWRRCTRQDQSRLPVTVPAACMAAPWCWVRLGGLPASYGLQ